MVMHRFSLSGHLPWAMNAWLKKLIVGLSEISYSVYLVHLSVLLWAMAWKPQFQGSPLTLLGLFVVTNAASVAFYFAFERHHLAIRHWLREFLLRRDSTDKYPV